MHININIKNKKRNSSFIPGGKYQKLRSIEDLLDTDNKRYSVDSNISLRTPAHNTYNKRFSEQSFNSISNVSETCSTSGSTSFSIESNDFNDIYSCYKPEYNNYNINNEPEKKKKKHRKRKALSKIFQSFSLDGQLQQSMQCPDWEYYCNNGRYNY